MEEILKSVVKLTKLANQVPINHELRGLSNHQKRQKLFEIEDSGTEKGKKTIAKQ